MQEEEEEDAFSPGLPLPLWNHSDECDECGQVFGVLLRRRHHCRLCGRSLCGPCLGPGTVAMPALVRGRQRCCGGCLEERRETVAAWQRLRCAGPPMASSAELREWFLVLHERRLQWDPLHNELNRLARRGVAAALRATVWPLLLGARVEADAVALAAAAREAGCDEELLQLDLPRCGEGEGRRRAGVQVLCCAVLPVAPYEQGGCLVAAGLLRWVPQGLAVGCLCAVQTGSRLQGPREGPWAARLERLAAARVPRLGPLLRRGGGLEAAALCHAWLRTAFAGFVPPAYAARIWDCFFVHGFDYLLRCALALLALAAPLLEPLPPGALFLALSPQRLPTLVCDAVSADELIELSLGPID